MALVIGLLGGIASGKSTVAGLLAARGCRVLDADEEARRAVEQPDVRRRLGERFGHDLYSEDGRLDRPLLAQRAFADPRATAELNAIVHPRVRERLLAGLDAAADDDRPVVLDVPLLMEAEPLAKRVDVWVFIESAADARDARAAERGWGADERARREAHQADLATKRRRATHLLENTGSIEDLGRRVDALLRELGIG